jgi:hypothetical protein
MGASAAAASAADTAAADTAGETRPPLTTQPVQRHDLQSCVTGLVHIERVRVNRPVDRSGAVDSKGVLVQRTCISCSHDGRSGTEPEVWR